MDIYFVLFVLKPVFAFYLDSASKHALQGYFDALRCEVTAEGISVSVISPGYIRTHLSHNALRGDGSTHGSK